MNRFNDYTHKKEFYSFIVNKNYYPFLKKELRKYTQHGKTSVYKHSAIVAYRAFINSKNLEKLFKIRFNNEEMVCAAFMHDFFMYDWHEKSTTHRLHGFTHPKVALNNAIKYCNATPFEASIIKSHMWPLTITKIPTSKEGWLICICDKTSAIYEFFKK